MISIIIEIIHSWTISLYIWTQDKDAVSVFKLLSLNPKSTPQHLLLDGLRLEPLKYIPLFLGVSLLAFANKIHQKETEKRNRRKDLFLIWSTSINWELTMFLVTLFCCSICLCSHQSHTILTNTELHRVEIK